MNPRTWVPKASTLPLDHRSRYIYIYIRCSSSSFIVTLLLFPRTACARAQFRRCSSTTNAHSETGQMVVCCQNLALGVLSSRSPLSMLVGALFKKSGLFLNTPHMSKIETYLQICLNFVRSVIPTLKSRNVATLATLNYIFVDP